MSTSSGAGNKARGASLFLGKDYERWAHHDPERMVGPAWKGVRSAHSVRVNQWNDAPTRLPMHASSLGIIAEHAHEKIPVNGSAMDGAVPLHWQFDDHTLFSPSPTSPDVDISPAPKSPVSAESLASRLIDAKLRSPPALSSPGVVTPPVGEPSKLDVLPRVPATKPGTAKPLFEPEASSSSWRQLPSAEVRRKRRLRLLKAAKRERRSTPSSAEEGVWMEPRIPLYGNLELYKLVPRRTVEYVEGTLYDAEGPFMEGATSDSLSVRLFYAPPPEGSTEEGVSYLITTPDNRVFSAAKRRRWAMDNRGNFFAAMEMKSIESKMAALHKDMRDPVHTEDYEQDLRQHFLDDVLDELQKAESLSEGSCVPPHLLQTEDGKLVRLEKDFPEEVFFAIAGCTDAQVYPVIAKVFVEAIQALWDLHSHGWMHGDIKLENLMFDETGKLVLIDFENASPFRGSRQHDGKIQLLSFDWTPPEMEVSHLGRRIGPSGDLWALGCNLIRAFALRDGVEDSTVREMLLGDGLPTFFAFRETLLHGPEHDFGVDLAPLLALADTEKHTPHIHPARMLRRFAYEAPRLLQYVLHYSVAPTPTERNELKGVRLAQEMLDDPRNRPLWDEVKHALDKSIAMSGSTWVRPKLDEARAILELS